MTGGLSVIKATITFVTLLALSVFAGACGLIGNDDGGSGGATVRAVVFSSESNAQGQPVNPRAFFAPNTPQITATVLLENVKQGMRITGAWYQLGTANAGAEGARINASDVTLSSEQTSTGQTTVTFQQRSGGSGFPEDTWLLRIYVNGDLVRTSGFIITRAAQASASPAAPGPAAPPAPPAPAPTPVTYTVVAGDSLQSVAQRFLPPGQNLQTYLADVARCSNLAPTATLIAGQVLRIPPC